MRLLCSSMFSLSREYSWFSFRSSSTSPGKSASEHYKQRYKIFTIDVCGLNPWSNRCTTSMQHCATLLVNTYGRLVGFIGETNATLLAQHEVLTARRSRHKEILQQDLILDHCHTVQFFVATCNAVLLLRDVNL